MSMSPDTWVVGVPTVVLMLIGAWWGIRRDRVKDRQAQQSAAVAAEARIVRIESAVADHERRITAMEGPRDRSR